MKRIASSLSLAVCSLFLLASMAVAQSSGNFSASVDHAVCMLNSSTGQLTPGCTPTANGTNCASLSDPIKVPGGNGVVVLVTPSMVTGLFTDTKINSQFNSSTADVGIQVCVDVTDSSGNPVKNAVFGGDANGCVVYDQRFQQISSGLFSQISSCVPTVTATACTTDADCSSLGTNTTSAFCNNPSGNAGQGLCETFPTACNFELILSTLSAHAYNFIVVPPAQGTYSISANWSLIGVNTSGSANVAACTGPGTLTALQGKVFSNSGSLP